MRFKHSAYTIARKRLNSLKRCRDLDSQVFSDKYELIYGKFISQFFFDTLCLRLTDGANYQRRASCLELILFILKERFVDDKDLLQYFSRKIGNNLMNMLNDSHESIVKMAAVVITMIPAGCFEQYMASVIVVICI